VADAPTFATLQDLATRYPRELLTLAADETTGIRDDARILAVLGDVSVEIRSILLKRYRRAELENLDDDARSTLRVYAMDMALYRVSVSFSRSSDRYKDGYDNALKALRRLTDGDGALGVIGGDPTPDPAEDGTATADNGRVLMESNERLFTRNRMRGL
jgi:phage gp36-like protein